MHLLQQTLGLGKMGDGVHCIKAVHQQQWLHRKQVVKRVAGPSHGCQQPRLPAYSVGYSGIPGQPESANLQRRNPELAVRCYTVKFTSCDHRIATRWACLLCKWPVLRLAGSRCARNTFCRFHSTLPVDRSGRTCEPRGSLIAPSVPVFAGHVVRSFFWRIGKAAQDDRASGKRGMR